MRCFLIEHDRIAGPGFELTATTDDEAIIEAKQITAAHNWSAFEVWDGPRVVFSTLRSMPTTAD
jgi:hypothetical protein